MRGFAFIILYLLFLACSSAQQRQGIKGQVLLISGNQLPGPENTKRIHYGVQRELFIYELTTTSQVTQNADGFFTDVETKLITTLKTKVDGSFKLRLPPGQYSVLVQEQYGLYANLFDKNNAINPIIVKENEYAWLPITIDYQAVY